MPTPHDYYEILEVKPEDDVALIKSQYRKLVRLNHPDISAVEKRAAYDRARQNRSAAKAAENGTPVNSTISSRMAPRAAPGAARSMPRSRSAPSSYGGRPAARSGGGPNAEPASAAT